MNYYRYDSRNITVTQIKNGTDALNDYGTDAYNEKFDDFGV